MICLWCCCTGRDVSVTRAIQDQLKIISTLDKTYNSFITVNRQGALSRAQELDASVFKRGSLHGMSVAIKDNIEVAGMPNTAGTELLRNYIPRQDATVVARLKEAGAVIIGKTNLHELAFGITNNNYVYGAVRNAHNPELFSGGSSGGTAVAIASGMVRAGLGTDTGGSSRIPAALNGIVGFRPTVGRYPQDGIVLISDTRDTVGPMARNVADVVALDSALSGDDSKLPDISIKGLRLGVPRAYFYENLAPEVERVATQTLRALEKAGVTLVEANLEGVPELNAAISFTVVRYESLRLLAAYLLSRNLSGLAQLIERIRSPDVKGLLSDARANPVPNNTYQTALREQRPQLQKAYINYFKQHAVDAIVFPTTPLTARPIQGSDATVTLNGEPVPTFLTYIRNVDPSSNAGIPGITIPMGDTADGLPIGLEVEALAGQDKKLLAIGRLLEARVLTK